MYSIKAIESRKSQPFHFPIHCLFIIFVVSCWLNGFYKLKHLMMTCLNGLPNKFTQTQTIFLKVHIEVNEEKARQSWTDRLDWMTTIGSSLRLIRSHTTTQSIVNTQCNEV